MIKHFQHKGLERFFRRGETKGIKAQHQQRIQRILDLLDDASEPQELAIPGMFLHPLKGDRKGQWAMTVSGFGPMGIGPAQYLSFHQDAGTRLDTAFVLTSPGPLVPVLLRIHLSSL